MRGDTPSAERTDLASLLPGMPERGAHTTLYRLWLKKRAAVSVECRGELPGRGQFDPLEMPELLPNLTLFDVERRPLRFRIRLVGTAIVAAMGKDTTGLYLDQLDRIEAVERRACELVESKSPYFLSDQPLSWTHRDYKTYSVLGLPLASDGKSVDMLLYSMLFS